MNMPSNIKSTRGLNKVPDVTLVFWIIKILSTTVGETGADFLIVNVGFGDGVTCLFMSLALVAVLSIQLRAKQYVPWIYWLTVVLVSIVGTLLTDILTDGLNVSLFVSTPTFAGLLIAIFTIWFRLEQTLSIQHITSRRREWFYWAAILCTFALGTATGDLATEALELGFIWGTLIFGALIGLTFAAWRLGGNSILTFWIAYILTRPFGASLGDWLTQAKTYGGLGFGPMWTSALFLGVIVILVTRAQRRAAQNPNSKTAI